MKLLKLVLYIFPLWLSSCNFNSGFASNSASALDGAGAGDSDGVSDPIPPGPAKSCNKSENFSNITKPRGVFTSTLTTGAVANSTIQGGLIRVPWAELETSPGVFNWNKIETQLALLPTGKQWSLAIHGGWTSLDSSDPDYAPPMALSMSPAWLASPPYSVPTFSMSFRGVPVNMPYYWNATLQTRIQLMMNAVAAKYKSDVRLQLVYVPQMTSNGVEGHFNGVSSSTLLTAAGAANEDQFEEIWVAASLAVSKIVANAFDNKAIAFEVHEVIARSSIPKRIMDTLLTDPDFQNRVGIAMWWISGKTSYQPNLVEIIKNYRGDLYGQIIDKSSNATSFQNNDYTQVLVQAKELCMRYIEPWNYEFENNTYNSWMTDFNSYSAEYF